MAQCAIETAFVTSTNQSQIALTEQPDLHVLMCGLLQFTSLA